MYTLPEDKLREMAIGDAGPRLKSIFTKAELTLDQGPNRTEWDPILRRHVFHSTIQAWRDFDQIEFIVSPEGRIRLFRDKNRLEPKGPADPPLTSADLLQIAATTGEVGPSAIVETAPTPGPMLTFTVRQAELDMPMRIRFVVNGALRQVAAMEVLPDPIGLPGVPQAPGMPNLPQAPGMPKAPSLPNAPSIPQAPASPSPGLPKAPQVKLPEVKFP
ncbi:MAG: hypothetical protein IT435_01635 [Phycisphaerales bacterium]|nr:hypothetical protein [Phycisphaerales bacterium]